MLKPGKAEHVEDAMPRIMDAYGAHFNEVFRKAKVDIPPFQRDGVFDRGVFNTREYFGGLHPTGIDRSMEDPVPSQPKYRVRAVAEPSLPADLAWASTGTISPNSSEGVAAKQEQCNETSVLRETTKRQNEVAQSVNEALLTAADESMNTAIANNDLIRYRVPLSCDAAVNDHAMNDKVQHDAANVTADGVLNSDLDDDEDVADCLLGPSVAALRARRWEDQGQESPASLSVQSMIRRTGMHELVAGKLYHELHTKEQEGLLADDDDRAIGGSQETIEDHQQDAIGAYATPNPDDSIRVRSIAHAHQLSLKCADLFSKSPSLNIAENPLSEEDKEFLLDGKISEDGDAESDGGVPVKHDDYRHESPDVDSTSAGYVPVESVKEPQCPAGAMASNERLTEDMVLSSLESYAVKRIQRQSAPAWLHMSHDRSVSDATLVNSPTSRSKTPSPLSLTFPQHQSPTSRHIMGDAKIGEAECALRVKKAVDDAIETNNREWESADAAGEQRHEDEIADLKEDHEAHVKELHVEHQEALEKQRKRHKEKIKMVRKQGGKVAAEKKVLERTLYSISTQRDVLQEELGRKNEQLEQALQANDNQNNHQQNHEPGTMVDMRTSSKPSLHDRHAEPDPAMNEHVTQQAAHYNATITQLQDNLEQCQEARDLYMAKSERYHAALIETLSPDSLAQVEAGRDRELAELRSQVHEYKAALEDVDRVRAADREEFTNHQAIIHESLRRAELDNKAMDLSKKAAWARNKENISKMQRSLSDNEIDNAVWEQYRIVERENEELRQNARGYERREVEKGEEINVLKAKIVRLELQGPKHEEQVRRLEEEAAQLKFAHDTALRDCDIAIHDQEKREPELWRSMRDKPLKQKDERIAHLEAQLFELGIGGDDHSPGTSSNIGEPVVSATPPHPSTPIHISDNDTTIKHDIFEYSPPGLLFGKQQATRPEDFATPQFGTPADDQRSLSSLKEENM